MNMRFQLKTFFFLLLLVPGFSFGQDISTLKLLGRGIINQDSKVSIGFACLNIKDTRDLVDSDQPQIYHDLASKRLNLHSIECNAIRVIQFNPESDTPEWITLPILLSPEIQPETYAQEVFNYVSFISGTRFSHSVQKEISQTTSNFFDQKGWNWAEKPIRVSNQEFNEQLFWISGFNQCQSSPCVLKFQGIDFQPKAAW
jgi:hypothetical protein